jgi:FeS assembly SUF system regulator
MIRITRQTDYGIILLTYLAGQPADLVHTARDVAEAAGLPLPMVSKILKVLAREGLLATKRGVKGGYCLALPPESITLAQVIHALEGPIGMTDCASAPGSCEWEPRCPVRVNWQRISGAVREALDKIPLSEMVGTGATPAGAGSHELLAVGDPVPWNGS